MKPFIMRLKANKFVQRVFCLNDQLSRWSVFSLGVSQHMHKITNLWKF